MWIDTYNFELKFITFDVLGGVVLGINASVEELEGQGRLMAQIRSELGTNRELLNRLYQSYTAAERLAAAPPFLHPLQEDEPRASDLNPREAEGASFLGGNSLRRSVGNLISLGSVKSVRSPCALPLSNTFATTRM